MGLNEKLFLILILPVLLIAVLTESVFAQAPNSIQYGPFNNSSHYLEVISNTEGHKQVLRLPTDSLLFNITPQYNQADQLKSFSMKLKPELTDLYNKLGLFGKLHDIVFIYPSFTQAAYDNNGFYDYYNGKCDTSCLTVPIPTRVNGIQASSIAGALVLKLLDYPYVKDEDIDKNPDILKQYKRVIVLHNEYVTKKEFDAITSHPDVVFLYPNALYAEVKTNYDSNTITLVRGHGYPDKSIKNGFDWKNDNSKYEYNVFCDNWTYYRSRDNNYSMLNCYPEYKILSSPEMLTELQIADPTVLIEDTGNWLRYPNDPHYVHVMLEDYDINATYVPPWIANPALWLENGEITKSEFLQMLGYLYNNNIIR
jgi:hypothetical protein